MPEQADIEALKRRTRGEAPTGDVTVRSFDEGVVVTMGAEVKTPTQKTAGFGSNYFLVDVPNVGPPPGYPGVPVLFHIPDDVFSEMRMPFVHVNRTAISPAMNRWHPGNEQYNSPSPTATKHSLTFPNGDVVEGYSSYVSQPQAVPFDIQYTVRVIARNRGGKGRKNPRNQANALFMHLGGVWQPYSAVFVRDTIGDTRSYHVETDYAVEDALLEVTNRMIGFSFDLRVEGELDLNPEVETQAVTEFPTIQETLGNG